MNILAAWKALQPPERVARCRSLSVAARLLLGRNGEALVALLRRGESEDAALAAADEAIDRLPTATKRRLLSTMLWQ